MPYKELKVGKGRVKVINSKTGKVHAKSTTPAKAAAQERLMEAIKHNPGFVPRNKGK